MIEQRGESFPRTLRLTKREEFRRVFVKGERYSRPPLDMVSAQNDAGISRLGLAVSRKVGNAVARNLVKRRLRELFRRNLRALPERRDFVFLPGPGAARLAFAEFRVRFFGLMEDVKSGAVSRRPRRREEHGKRAPPGH